MSLVPAEIHLLVLAFQRIPGEFQMIVSSCVKGKILREADYENSERNFQRFYKIFKLIYGIQILRIVWHHKSRQISLTGITPLYLLCRFGIGIVGFVTYSFLLNTCQELVAMINILYNQPFLRCSKLLAVFMRCNRYSVYLIAVVFIFALATSSYKPIDFAFSKALPSRWIVRGILDTIISFYEVWNYFVIVPLAVLSFVHGMYASYAGIYILAKQLSSTKNVSDSYRISSLKELLILVSLINSCFQKTVSICIKAATMTVCILCGVVLLNPTFKSSLSQANVILLLYVVASLYFLMAFGYYFPGSANFITAKMIVKAKAGLTGTSRGRQRMVEEKRIAAMQPVRLRFGSVNYYEQDTFLVITHFLLEKTASLSLIRT